jgi:LCP family protein required for cell wall assembly
VTTDHRRTNRSTRRSADGSLSARRHGRHHRPPRWPRRILVGTNVIVALILVSVGVGYGYIRYVKIGGIKTGSSAGLSASAGVPAVQHRQSSGGLEPENILLIGNETRAGQVDVNFGNPQLLTGSLSDVIMIVHLDPRKDSASVLSIPRDVFVPMPPGTPSGPDRSPNQKIDAALNDGKFGPNNLVNAITEDFGIPINHYVEVDFDGFLNVVDALGGIEMDFPERLYDAYSNLDITHTGCQVIHGKQALALVRSRHLQYDPPGVSPQDVAAWPYDPESNLARIVRDQELLRVLVTTAESKGFTNPLRINSLLSAVLGSLTVDPGFKSQLLTLALHYRHLDAALPKATTIPVTEVNGPSGAGYTYEGFQIGDVEFPDEPADLQTIDRWDPGVLPSPVRPSAVKIYNIAGTPSLAADTGAALRSDGFNVTTETNGTIPASVSETVVQYHPGQLAEGFSVFEKLTGAVVMQADPRVPAGTVDVQAGTTFAVVGSPTSSGSTTPSSTSSSTPASSPSTTVPTPGGQAPSSAANKLTPYDPRPC